jgi:hypothetical protein
MRTLSTEISINAPAEKVWRILSDFSAYPNWNPFITQVKGNLTTGARLNVTLTIEGRKPTVVRPKLITVIPGEKICWLGSILVRGIFDGMHHFTLEETDDGQTLFRQGENFSGILAGAIMNKIRHSTLKGFEEMNLALKKQAES